ncbi:MAG: hypothetical protein AB1696_01520 [Planctomycetota bacterium]
MRTTRLQACALSFCVLTTYVVMAADERPGWVNAKDCGASGSVFETTASTAAESKEIVVKDVGDFKAGQGVMISRCNPHYERCFLKPPDNPYAVPPLGDAAELRGYDGSIGSWLVFLVEINSAEPLTFRWSDDMARTWKGEKVPVTYDWQPLSSGVEIKLKKREWQPGHMITFQARDQLVSKIEKIEGNVLTLAHAATRTATDAVVRHCDSDALQAAVTRALKEKQNVFIPAGHYRLTTGLSVNNAAGIVVEGASGAETVLDISEGCNACVSLRGGAEVTVRNLRMVGHTGLGEGPGWRSFRTSSGKSCWPVGLKPCAAMYIRNTERVLIENCHASKMNCEAFYCQGDSRVGSREPKEYTKSLTYLRCSATNCDGNGFNNNDMAENTSLLYCRIVDVGGCSWEGASRFVKIIGNYVCNAGPIAMGNIRSRAEHFEQLGSGQHIVANNVFERRRFYAGRPGNFIICASAGANQVVIANNLFINFNSSGVHFSGATSDRDLPTKNGTITGNIFDMTCQDEESLSRTAIQVSASDAIVGDNQIYIRGQCDPKVTGIQLTEPALNLNVHDNLIRNCAVGVLADCARSRVGEIIDSRTFIPGSSAVTLEHRRSHRYRGWNMAWFAGAKPNGVSVVEAFDPETCRFTLVEPRKMSAGESFEVFPPYGANWNIHSNTIAGCLRPVVLDSYGSPTSILKDNIISRGDATGVEQAVSVSGQFVIIGNQISGFNEKDAAALALNPDRVGRKCRRIFRKNILQDCANVVKEAEDGLWKSAVTDGNLFIQCGGAPEPAAEKSVEQEITPVVIQPPKKPEFLAPRLAAPVKIDGDVAEWPWQDKARVVNLERDPAGGLISSPKGQACAAFDDGNLYLAIRFDLPKGAKLQPKGGFDQGDGVEVSFRNADPKHPTPILLLWGSASGTHEGSTAMGASAEQAEALRKATTYAAKQTPTGWSCEWHIPFSAMGLKAADIETLLFNLGLSCTATGSWLAWAPTGGRLCDVDKAGELVMEGKGPAPQPGKEQK